MSQTIKPRIAKKFGYNMIEEGLYDNEPNFIRATLYERIFGAVPFAGYEVHDTLIQREKLLKWIDENGYVLSHTKTGETHDDGEERFTRYFLNEKNKTMIMFSRRHTSPKFIANVMSSDNSPGEQNKNPNKFSYISFFGPTEELVIEFKTLVQSFRIKEDPKNKLYMLKATDYGSLELDSFPTNSNGMKLDLNYGKSFLPVHESILENLRNKKSGLYIFRGPPGTGKTSYIKHLTTIVSDRKFIFVPNTMVSELFSPKLVDKLYSFKNSVLVLEDAEVCVFKRDGSNNALVSGILNITDGLLKDLLNIAIMVTFNAAEVEELDKALLRKGRLKLMHKFDLLPLEDAKALAKHLKMKTPVTTSLSLADVYNLDEETGLEVVPEKSVGFNLVPA
jgi:hypothetical protein